ncbi:MAG: hypothetical protein AAB295_06400 [Chloroflexota bacterium]
MTKNLLADFTGGQSWADVLRKENLGAGASNRPTQGGRKVQPANFEMCSRFKTINVYHSTCIEAETNSTVGLGFASDKVKKTLDPLCVRSFGSVIRPGGEDFFATGNGYLEVVRDAPGGKILGLHHMQSPPTFAFVEEDGRTFHYEFEAGAGMSLTGSSFGSATGLIKMPRFGDSKRFFAKFKDRAPKSGATISEVIHFADPSALSRWYGMPKWLANTVAMELMHALDQREFDFFINRGVPEFIFLVTGAKVGVDDWKVIKTAMQAHIGLGNSHKTFAANIPDPNAKVQVEKLDAEGADQGDRYSKMTDALALKIVSAHQVPPLLAGIQLPGKMAAANELPNAIRAFQILKVGPAQEVFQDTLATPLGDPTENGGLGLTADDFKLKKITDELDLDAMETSSRMRETEPEAAAAGRDLKDGLKKELTSKDREAAGEVLAHALAAIMAQSDRALREDVRELAARAPTVIA